MSMTQLHRRRGFAFGVLCDSIEDPAATVVTAGALGPLEQAQPPSRRSRWMLGENRTAAQEDRRRRQGRLDAIARQDPLPLVVQLHAPPHADLIVTRLISRS